MPNIVVLDGYTLNPGDNSWEAFESLGSLTVHDRTPVDKTYERIKDADIVLTNKAPLSKDVLDKTTKLKYIGVLATGYNIVDTQSASKKSICVTNVPGYSGSSVAQFVFSHILEHASQVGIHTTAVQSGSWANSKDFCFYEKPTTEIDTLTLGIFGLGDIGLKIAHIALSFGMKVIATKRSPLKKAIPGLSIVDKETLLKESDFITLNCPLTPETENLINKDSLSLMKKNAILINTGRGQLIHEQDLADALNSNRIAGAGLDVLSTEPPQKDNPLLTAKNCTITPHIAWSTLAARKRLMQMAANNLSAFLSDTPINQVN